MAGLRTPGEQTLHDVHTQLNGSEYEVELQGQSEYLGRLTSFYARCLMMEGVINPVGYDGISFMQYASGIIDSPSYTDKQCHMDVRPMGITETEAGKAYLVLDQQGLGQNGIIGTNDPAYFDSLG